MNNLCFYNPQAVYQQNEFQNSFQNQPQQTLTNSQLNMLEMINLLNQPQISQQQNMIDLLMTQNRNYQPSVPRNPYQFDNLLDQNNNFQLNDDMLRKEMEQLKYLQRKQQHQQQQQQQKSLTEPVSKEYILSQLKAQQRVKQTQQFIKEQAFQSSNQTTDNLKSLLLNNKINQSIAPSYSPTHQPNVLANQIEIFNDGNIKNIPPNILLDQFGMVGLAMMLKLNDSDSNLSMVMGKGEESKSITQSIRENFEYDSILCDSKNVNHLEPVKSNGVYNLSSIKQDMLDVNLVLKNSQEDLLFYLFYMCCSGDKQIIASNLLTSRGWFFNKELNLWLKQVNQDKRSYFIFDVNSWSIKQMSLEDLAKMSHKSD